MKRILHISYMNLFLLIVGVVVSSCNNKEKYDIYGETENRVYISSPGARNFEVVHTPLCSVGEVEMHFPVCCTHRANGDIEATFSIDNSLVETYNLAHGTDYGIVPDKIINLENVTLVIASNATSTDKKMKMYIAEDDLPQLKTTDRYLIPIRLKEVTGNASLSTNNSIIYVSLVTEKVEENFREGVTLDAINAVFIADEIRTEWTAELSVIPSYQQHDYTKLFDGITNIYKQQWQFESKTSPIPLIIDLKKVYEDIIGFRLIGMAKNVDIAVSIDKENWTEIGKTITDKRDIAFYAPLELQYVRFTFPLVKSGWSGSKASGYLHEFYACTKK